MKTIILIILIIPSRLYSQELVSNIDIDFLEQKIIELADTSTFLSSTEVITFWEDTAYKRLFSVSSFGGYAYGEIDFPNPFYEVKQVAGKNKDNLRFYQMDSLLLHIVSPQKSDSFLIVNLTKDVLLSGEYYSRLGFEKAVYQISIQKVHFRDDEIIEITDFLCILMVDENESASISLLFINQSERTD